MRVRGSLSFPFRISPACLGPKLKCASSPPCRWYPVLSLAGEKKRLLVFIHIQSVLGAWQFVRVQPQGCFRSHSLWLFS